MPLDTARNRFGMMRWRAGGRGLPFPTGDIDEPTRWEFLARYPGLTMSIVTVIGRAVETEVARAFTVVRQYTIGRAVEEEIARAFTWTRAYTFGRAIEYEIARHFPVPQVFTLGRAIEQEIARAIAGVSTPYFKMKPGVARMYGRAAGVGRILATKSGTARFWRPPPGAGR